jgi:hypothetical protein
MVKILFQNKRFFLFAAFLVFISNNSIFGFRVVLDPGHGGRYLEPNSIYGDKYDAESALFLEAFRPGASINGMNENEDVYEIALKVKEILDLTLNETGKKKFLGLLKKYDNKSNEPVIDIEAFISRDPGYKEEYRKIDYDINRNYRLYDHYDILNHEHVQGVISKINSIKPELVVSIHLTGGNPDKYGGLSAVITPGYQTFKMAYDYVVSHEADRNSVETAFKQSNYSQWFIGQHGRSAFEWFLCDSWIYFTGYWSTADGLNPDMDKFRGIRQNFITWNYRDIAPVGYNSNPNQIHLKRFKAEGKFWEREKDIPETWRRENGLQGYGGDNLYASEEILRFIRKGLLINGVRSQWNLPPIVKPYISTWSTPTYVNAVAAYLEIGYLNNPHDFDRIYRYKNIHAESIAMGIYSLIKGTQKNTYPKSKNLPWGEPLDFEKYKNFNGKNYFEIVQ